MNWLLQLLLSSITKRLDTLEKKVTTMSAETDALKQSVTDLETSYAALKARVETKDAALQAEIDALKANPPAGLSDADAGALATRLQAIVSDEATVDPAAPTT